MIFDNQYEQQRIEKANALRQMGINPYPQNIKKELSAEQFLKDFSYVRSQADRRDTSKIVSLHGRIKFLRLMGKAAFAKIEDESGIVQIYISRDALPEGFYNDVFKKLIEVGDIITVSGYPFVTKTDELSLHVSSLTLS